MPQVVTIRSLPRAFEINKSMEHDGYEWGEDYRAAGRAALVDVLEGRLREAIDRHLEGLSTRKVAKALLPVLGAPVSPATVSRVGRIDRRRSRCLPAVRAVPTSPRDSHGATPWNGIIRAS